MTDREKLEQRRDILEFRLKSKDYESDEDRRKLESELKKLKIELEPRYFMVEMEVTIPATVRYKVLADTPEEALDKAKRMLPTEQPKFKTGLMKRLKAQVFKYGTRLIEFQKNF